MIDDRTLLLLALAVLVVGGLVAASWRQWALALIAVALVLIVVVLGRHL